MLQNYMEYPPPGLEAGKGGGSLDPNSSESEVGSLQQHFGRPCVHMLGLPQCFVVLNDDPSALYMEYPPPRLTAGRGGGGVFAPHKPS